MKGLSGRERQVLELIASGLNTVAIAERLHISFHTVRTYVERIRDRYAMGTMAGAVAAAFRAGDLT